MREIKFRAWDENKEKLVFDFTKDKKKVLALIVNESQLELMQYTGLKDKNGVEIYEGDIVIVIGLGTNFIGEVKYKVGGDSDVLGYVYERKPSEYFYIYPSDDVEVIGNIHENPELLVSTDTKSQTN